MKKRSNEHVTHGFALALCMLMLFIGVVALAKSAAFAEAATSDEPISMEENMECESPPPTARAEEPAEQDSPMASDPTATPTENTPTPEPTTTPAENTPTPTPEPTTTPAESTPTPEPTTTPAENTPSPEPSATPPETTPEATATPQPTPVAQPGSYSIQIDPPDGWFSGKVDMHVKIADMNGAGLSRLRILFATGSAWDTLVDSAENSGDYTLTLRENGTIYVEITDKLGNVQARSTAITCFDHDAPLVRASVSGDILYIESSDALSGVENVYVNSHKLTQSNNGTLDARIADYADGKEIIEIYAVDRAGNRSEIVRVKNPLYGKKPDDSSNTSSGENETKPSATKKPSKTGKKTATPTPSPTVTPVPTITPLPSCTPLPTVAPPSYPSIPSAGIPFISDGNMQTLDMLYSQATNKQFISIQTKSGETYYLVIDYDKPIDEDGDKYETYFLNLVDDRDLLDVLADDEKPTPVPTAEPTPTPTPTPLPLATPDPGDDDSSGMTKVASAVLLILLLVGSVMIVLVMLKKKNSDTQLPSFDEDDDEEDDDDEDRT